MIPLFLGLTAFNLLCLGSTVALGYLYGGTERGHYHILVGAMSALACCAVHCIVITYFMATAKWIQHAVLVKKLDEQLLSPTRSFKAQALPAAMLAMAVTLTAAFSGAAADNYGASADRWHHVLSVVAMVVNAAVAPREYRAIARNGRLIDRVLAEAASSDGMENGEQEMENGK